MDCWGRVRESLENQTCEMAKIAAKLISENLKYPDGTPVQCVIGCTSIGGGAEAARVAEQFQMENVVATVVAQEICDKFDSDTMNELRDAVASYKKRLSEY